MSDDELDVARPGMSEPASVEIPLDDRTSSTGRLSRDESPSSTSTSSFEELNIKPKFSGLVTPRGSRAESVASQSTLKSVGTHSSQRRTPPNLDVGEAQPEAPTDVYVVSATASMTSLPKRTGPSSFKTTSFDDPNFYAQTTSVTPPRTSPTSPTIATKKTSTFKGPAKAKRAKMTEKSKRSEVRDPDHINDIVKVCIINHIIFFFYYSRCLLM